MIVGLTGLKYSGKDTVAAYLVKKYGFEQRSIIRPMKESVAALFDIDYHDVDVYKNEDTGFTVRLENHLGQAVREFTFREFLQRYGMEAHRDIDGFGDNVWMDITMPLDGFYAGRSIVVSDVRFDNEARRMRMFNGVVVRVVRGMVQDPHSSELQDFNVDYELTNYGGIDDLYDGIEKMLVDLSAVNERIRQILRR